MSKDNKKDNNKTEAIVELILGILAFILGIIGIVLCSVFHTKTFTNGVIIGILFVGGGDSIIDAITYLIDKKEEEKENK